MKRVLVSRRATREQGCASWHRQGHAAEHSKTDCAKILACKLTSAANALEPESSLASLTRSFFGHLPPFFANFFKPFFPGTAARPNRDARDGGSVGKQAMDDPKNRRTTIMYSSDSD